MFELFYAVDGEEIKEDADTLTEALIAAEKASSERDGQPVEVHGYTYSSLASRHVFAIVSSGPAVHEEGDIFGKPKVAGPTSESVFNVVRKLENLWKTKPLVDVESLEGMYQSSLSQHAEMYQEAGNDMHAKGRAVLAHWNVYRFYVQSLQENDAPEFVDAEEPTTREAERDILDYLERIAREDNAPHRLDGVGQARAAAGA